MTQSLILRIDFNSSITRPETNIDSLVFEDKVLVICSYYLRNVVELPWKLYISFNSHLYKDTCTWEHLFSCQDLNRQQYRNIYPQQDQIR